MFSFVGTVRPQAVTVRMKPARMRNIPTSTKFTPHSKPPKPPEHQSFRRPASNQRNQADKAHLRSQPVGTVRPQAVTVRMKAAGMRNIPAGTKFTPHPKPPKPPEHQSFRRPASNQLNQADKAHLRNHPVGTVRPQAVTVRMKRWSACAIFQQARAADAGLKNPAGRHHKKRPRPLQNVLSVAPA